MSRKKHTGDFFSIMDHEEYVWAMRTSAYEKQIQESLSEEKDEVDELYYVEDKPKRDVLLVYKTTILSSFVPDEIILNVDDYTSETFDACILCGDVSGFTELCETYNQIGSGGPSRLTDMLNNFIGAMVQEIMSYGGDVIKFSGDAFLALWKNQGYSMREYIQEAINCALVIQKSHNNFITDVGVTLRVKLAISSGAVLFSLIGDSQLSHYIEVGQPILDTKDILDLCRAGDIIVSEKTYAFMDASSYLAEEVVGGKYFRILGVGESWRQVQKFMTNRGSSIHPKQTGDVDSDTSSSSGDSILQRKRSSEFACHEAQAWDAARRFGKKLGEKRCYCVRPNTTKVALPHKNKGQDFKSIISNAQCLWHKSITTFASLRQDVLSDLQNMDQVEGIKWKRFPSLNKILKGHRSGELTVLTGPTGCGKTTFMSEYSLDLALQGVSTLWGSFEIRNARLARTMLQQMVGMPLDKNLHLFETWADKFEQLPIYYMTFHGQQSIKVVMEAVEHAAYVHDINHVIIDNLQFMMGITEESKHMDRFWKQDSIVAAFRTFATRKTCHVTLVIHPRKERVDEELTTSSIFGGAKASQEADNVLLIQDKRLTGPRGKKYLQIAKNRYSGDLGVMSLDFDKDSLSYAHKKKKKSETSIEPGKSDNC